MKALFLNPPFEGKKYSRSSRSPAVTKSGTLYYPVYLAYACGLLSKENGIDVFFIDAVAEGYSASLLLQKIKQLNPDLIISDTSTPSIYNDIEICGSIKRELPNTKIFLVGTHPTVLAKETLLLSEAIDGIARKEYDFTIRELALLMRDGKEWANIDGITYRRDMDIINNRDRKLVDNLDELPFVTQVYKRFLNIKKYFFAAAQYPMVMLMTGRGCPFQCRWCLYPQTMVGHKYRLRTPGNVFQELEYIKGYLPEVKEIGFEDDTFTADISRCYEICELIIKKGLNIKWWANTRANLPLEVMKIMKAAGCRLLITGFESGSQAVLDNIGKSIKVADSNLFVKNAKKSGLLVHGCFVFGNIGETKSDIMETIKFARSLQIDTVQFFPMFIYPGTFAFQWAADKGYLNTKNYREWLTSEGYHNSILDLPDLKKQEVMGLCALARKKFYLRPSYILEKLKQSVLSFQEAKRNVKAFLTLSKFL